MELLQWKILQVIRETKDAITYVLEENNGLPVQWEAGQFLTFLISWNNREVRRSYSIAAAPGIDTHIAVTVKRKVNGAISRYIQDTWQPGHIVTSIPPTGMFTIDNDSAASRQIFFIAAGSGIVPVYALLKKVLHREPRSRVILIYQNYDEQSIIYRDQLQQLAQQYTDRFLQIDLLSRPNDPHTIPHRLNNELFEQLLSRYVKEESGNTLFYTCGPASFMRMVLFTLRVMGFREDQFRKENFTVDTIPVPAFTMDTSPRTVQLQYGNEHYRYSVAYPVTILQAALNNNITLPYSCRAGKCSACVARCLSGVVKMSNNEVLTEQDLQEGLVLTCVGYAETDVELKFE